MQLQSDLPQRYRSAIGPRTSVSGSRARIEVITPARHCGLSHSGSLPCREWHSFSPAYRDEGTAILTCENFGIKEAAKKLNMGVPALRKLVKDRKIGVLRGTWKLKFDEKMLSDYRETYLIKPRKIGAQ